MNTTKQFWTLLKFQAIVSPFVWMIPLAFCTPLFFMSVSEPSLNLILMTQNLFLVILLGALVLGPEIFTAAGTNQASGLGAEFMRTRAVDKDVLARAKAALFFATALIVPLAIVLYSLRSPDVKLVIYPKSVQLECLKCLPGSTLVADKYGRPNLVSIPYGNVLIASWRAWEVLALAILVQAFVYAIYPSRYRRYLLWALIALVTLAPMVGTYSSIHGSIPWDQRLFFSYGAHQLSYWVATLTALLLGQLWCERRFAGLEQ
jgi:hypothetical protein